MNKSLSKLSATITSIVVLAVVALPASALPSSTTLVDAGLQQIAMEAGNISWSIDGASEPSHVAGTTIDIQVEKPAGATVRSVFFIAGDGGNRNNSGHAPTDVFIAGVNLPLTHWAKITSCPGSECWNNFNTYYGDVTDELESVIEALPDGISNLSFDQGDGTDNDMIEGGALVVVWNDESAPLSTIYLMAGTSDPAGDSFTFNFPAIVPVNLQRDLIFSVGSSNSYQVGSWSQTSRITANNTILSNIAGGCDDSEIFNNPNCGFGGYNTIGGVGDDLTNPGEVDDEVVSYDRELDDELYRLNDVMNVGDTSLTVNTLNPSNNDNVYFAGLYLQDMLPTSNYCEVNAELCFPEAAESGAAEEPELAATGAHEGIEVAAGVAATLLGMGLVVARRRRVQ